MIPFLPLLLNLLLIGCILVLIAALLSPLEALGWWAGWFGHPKAGMQMPALTTEERDATAEEMRESPEHFLIYLSGIGAISGDVLEPGELTLCDELAARFPHTAVIHDVFPYAMNNRGLTGQRAFAAFWRAIQRLKLEGRRFLTNLVNIRNLFQVTVSADPRYGPIYNFGTAEVLRDGLLRRGYPVGSGIPVTMIGYSGGCQIALGAALYLKEWLGGAPLQVIGIGGVMADDPGLNAVTHIYHLYGTQDPVPKLGAICYAGRWPIMPHSPWNRAKAQGKITRTELVPMRHYGVKGYFSTKSQLASGESYLDHLIACVAHAFQLCLEEGTTGQAAPMLSQPDQRETTGL